jgi:hypothetical protein
MHHPFGTLPRKSELAFQIFKDETSRFLRVKHVGLQIPGFS